MVANEFESHDGICGGCSKLHGAGNHGANISHTSPYRIPLQVRLQHFPEDISGSPRICTISLQKGPSHGYVTENETVTVSRASQPSYRHAGKVASPIGKRSNSEARQSGKCDGESLDLSLLSGCRLSSIKRLKKGERAGDGLAV